MSSIANRNDGQSIVLSITVVDTDVHDHRSVFVRHGAVVDGLRRRIGRRDPSRADRVGDIAIAGVVGHHQGCYVFDDPQQSDKIVPVT